MVDKPEPGVSPNENPAYAFDLLCVELAFCCFTAVAFTTKGNWSQFCFNDVILYRRRYHMTSWWTSCSI